MGVTTWADGYGRWHASVPVDLAREERWGDDFDASEEARKAIRSELRARDCDERYLRRIRVVRVRLTNHGTAIYREA